MRRITISLNEDERQALQRLAQIEHRDPRKQAAWLIRKELRRQGYLEPPQKVPAGDSDD